MNKEYKEKIEKIKQELLILETLDIKPNYSDLAKRYNIDRRTIKKYNDGYCKENTKRIRKSKLDEFKEEIKEKLELPGITITGLYQYMSKDKEIGTYSNFYKYIKRNALKPNKNTKAHMRYETEFGQQLQFDGKKI